MGEFLLRALMLANSFYRARKVSRRRSLARKVAFVEPRHIFILVCEGRNTEPQYFDALRRHGAQANIEVIFLRGAGCPMTLAQCAAEEERKLRVRRRKSRYAKNDQVWVVFDRDEHPNIPGTISLCAQKGIKIAFSDPCFELWLLLHLEDFDRPDHRHDVQKALEGRLNGYSVKGGKAGDMRSIMNSVEDAESRAEKQLKRREDEGSVIGCPHTTVFRLTRALRGAAIS